MFLTMILRFPQVVETQKKLSDDDTVEENLEEKKEEKKKEKKEPKLVLNYDDEKIKEIIEDSAIAVVRDEIDAAIRMILNRLPYEDDEEAKEESHLESVKTVHSGGMVEETPEELCHADCLTRAIAHGFGMYGLLVSGMWITKLTMFPKMSNRVLYGFPGIFSYITTGVLTLRCFLACHPLKQIKKG